MLYRDTEMWEALSNLERAECGILGEKSEEYEALIFDRLKIRRFFQEGLPTGT